MSQGDRNYLGILIYIIVVSLVARYISFEVAVLVFLGSIVAGLGYIAAKIDDLNKK